MTEHFDLTRQYNSSRLNSLRREILERIFGNPEYKLGAKNTVDVEFDHTLAEDGLHMIGFSYRMRGAKPRAGSYVVWDSLAEILNINYPDKTGVERIVVEIQPKGKTVISAEMSDEYITTRVIALAEELPKYKDAIAVVMSMMALFAAGTSTPESIRGFCDFMARSPVSPDAKIAATCADGTEVEMNSIREILIKNSSVNDFMGLKDEWYRFIQSFLIVKVGDEMTKLGVFKHTSKNPLFEFMRHLRNSQAHGGLWNFANEEPKHEASFKTFTLDSSMHGENPRHFLSDGDIFDLFDQLKGELLEFSKIHQDGREKKRIKDLSDLRWGHKMNFPHDGIMYEITLDPDGPKGKDCGKGHVETKQGVFYIKSIEETGTYDPKHLEFSSNFFNL